MKTKEKEGSENFTSKDWENIAYKLYDKIKELSKTPKGRLQIKRAGFNVPKKTA